jgi:hypothetical protein
VAHQLLKEVVVKGRAIPMDKLIPSIVFCVSLMMALGLQKALLALLLHAIRPRTIEGKATGSTCAIDAVSLVKQ